MLASKIRKGTKVEIEGVVVRVTQREKWNSKRVKIHFEDCGNGLPEVRFGSEYLAIKEKMFDLDQQLEVL